MIDHTKAMHVENVALFAQVRKLEDEMVALKNFARDVVQETWRSCEVDGCHIQDLAAKYGLITKTVATEADSMAFDHVAPGDDFFRLADWLVDAP